MRKIVLLQARDERTGWTLVLTAELSADADAPGEDVTEEDEPSGVRASLRPLVKALPRNVVPLRLLGGVK